MVKGSRLLASGNSAPLPYDAEVEYIESTGTQTIDTGIVVDDNYYVLQCDMCSSTLGQSVAWSTYFGSYNGESAKSTRIINNATNLNSMYGGYMRRSNGQRFITGNYFVAQDRSQYTLEYMKMTIVRPEFGDWIIPLDAPEGNPDTSTVKLFGACMRCWGFRISHEGVDVIDFIPVRFTNEQGVSEGAMYDRVSGQLFRNAGTGAFLWAEKQ